MNFYNKNILYNSLLEKISQVKGLSKEFSVNSLGTTVCGRNILSISKGTLSGCLLIVAGVHGVEWITSLIALKFLEDNPDIDCDITVIPMLNPDGAELASGYGVKWSANGRGVDINQNFNADWEAGRERLSAAGYDKPGATRYPGKFPESEPETRAVVEFISKNRPRIVIALHSQGEEIYSDYKGKQSKAARDISERMAQISDYALCSPHPLAQSGGLKDYYIDKFGGVGITLEVGKGENPLPISDFPSIYSTVSMMLLVATESLESLPPI